MVLPALREENLANIEEGNNKKFVVLPCQVEERRKVEKPFWKRCFETVKELF